MLARDFVADSLYNPRYGYFARRAALLPPQQQLSNGNDADDGGFRFREMKDQRDFMAQVEERYNAFERTVIQQGASTPTGAPVRPPPTSSSTGGGGRKRPNAPSPSSAAGLEAAQALGRAAYEQSLREDQSHDVGVQSMLARQVWHTPTTLFRPHYARIVAQHCLDTLQGPMQRGEPLVIYELGAGDGSLTGDVMRYLEEVLPSEAYERVEYNIVEISERLAKGQEEKLAKWVSQGKVRVHRRDFLEWDQREERSCVVIALEVLDNLPHDVVRYGTSDLLPYQAYISIDGTGDFAELYTPAVDPLIRRYLDLLQQVRPGTVASPPGVPRWLSSLPTPLRRGLAEHWPLFPNLTKERHFLPTGALHLIDVLAAQFPKHHTLISDFSALPQAVKGVDGPVVQTRLARNAGPVSGGRGGPDPNSAATPVAVSTYAVLQGFFDIFYPTNFEVLRDIYGRVVAGKRGSGTNGTATVSSHRAFLERYPDLAKQCALNGGRGPNPMLEWYANVKWLTS